MWDRWMMIDDLMMIDDDRTSVYQCIWPTVLEKNWRKVCLRIRDTNFH
ncbi:MAG: hypothetical protein ACI8RD_004741, partial [Bacillariaceae sp.]